LWLVLLWLVLVRMATRGHSRLVADMLNRNWIAGGKSFFQRFVELPLLASPVGGFIVHGGSVAGKGAVLKRSSAAKAAQTLGFSRRAQRVARPGLPLGRGRPLATR